MSEAIQPDLGALYLKHRAAMYAVASSVLRGSGCQALAEDIVMEAMTSVLATPPTQMVMNWEAFFVQITKRKAIDLVRSAAVKHAGGALPADREPAADIHLADEVVERVDDEHLGRHLWDLLARLEPRDRRILYEYKGKGRLREDVAGEFGISPARVSQISTQALRTLNDQLTKEGLHR